MKTVLEFYDIYPKVVRAEKVCSLSIRPMGSHVAFSKDKVYRVVMYAMNARISRLENAEPPVAEVTLNNGIMGFSFEFGQEQQYSVIVQCAQNDKWEEICNLQVFALEEDFFALRPYKGDMHSHTCESDGVEGPEIVAANYRKAGFDFLAITDHGQYEPSLKAIEAYKDFDLCFKLFTGEEVHPPHTNVHTVHFGGDYSVNALFRDNPAQFEMEVAEIENRLSVASPSIKREYAVLVWVYEHIRKTNGLAIFPHPCWIEDHAYHTRRDMYQIMMEIKAFDALELTGGQTLEENQLQVNLWQQMREEGYIVPIVGSSDSHGTVNAQWFELSKMIVLSEKCERDEICDAVKARQVAVLEQYHGEPLPRVYGTLRMTEYALFLITEFYPIHDSLCEEEGRLMRSYVCGDQKSGEFLRMINGRTEELFDKYWAK